MINAGQRWLFDNGYDTGIIRVIEYTDKNNISGQFELIIKQTYESNKIGDQAPDFTIEGDFEKQNWKLLKNQDKPYET